jgi:hypothetical protein
MLLSVKTEREKRLTEMVLKARESVDQEYEIFIRMGVDALEDILKRCYESKKQKGYYDYHNAVLEHTKDHYRNSGILNGEEIADLL